MNTTGKHLGGGVVLYEDAFDVDWGTLCEFAEEQAQAEWESMYTPGKDPLTGEEGYINRNGYFFHEKGITEMPRHCAYLHSDPGPGIVPLLHELEYKRDLCAAEYMDRFPISAASVWWKIKGHFLVYPKGSFLGAHADTSTDYKYGVPHPTHQIATRTVISTLTFFNNSGADFTGGDLVFPYLDIRHQPKAGDLLIFPSNYMGAHECETVTSGTRFSHVGWYCQGSPDMRFEIDVTDPLEDPERAATATNVYLTEPLGVAMEQAWAGKTRAN